MTVTDIKRVLSLVRESDVEACRRANPYFRVLKKPDSKFVDGFVLAFDPEIISDLYPENFEANERTISQVERLYLANPEAFVRTVMKTTPEELYSTVRNSFVNDAEIIAFFGGEMDAPSAAVVEPEPEMEVEDEPEPEVVQPSPAPTQAPVQPSSVVKETPVNQVIDYSVMRGIMKELLDAHMVVQSGTQKEILDVVRSLARNDSSEITKDFTASLSDVVKSVNQIGTYINNVDMKNGEDRQAVRQLLNVVRDNLVEQTRAFGAVGAATDQMKEQSRICSDVVNRYSAVELLTDEGEFLKTLANLDKINSPGAFMLAFKEALKMLWYSGDREAVEKILVATVSILKEGV